MSRTGISSFGKQFWGILAYSTMWLLIGTDSNHEGEDLGQLLGEKLKVWICEFNLEFDTMQEKRVKE